MQISNTEQDPMSAACQWLDQHGITYRRMTEYQIKIGRINFYPGKGTCILDGQKVKHSSTGLNGLKELLVAEGRLRLGRP